MKTFTCNLTDQFNGFSNSVVQKYDIDFSQKYMHAFLSPYETCSHLSYIENCLESINRYNLTREPEIIGEVAKLHFICKNHQLRSYRVTVGRLYKAEMMMMMAFLKFRLLNYCFRRQHHSFTLGDLHTMTCCMTWSFEIIRFTGRSQESVSVTSCLL